MKRLLCFDISADDGVVGISDAGAVLVERRVPKRDLFASTVEALLRELDLRARDFTGIALGNGPGSFTGLRVGLAFAKGFAYAAGLPVWPVSSLQVIAYASLGAANRIAVISPARRGRHHFAVYAGSDLAVLEGHCVIGEDDLPAMLGASTLLVGPGVLKLPPTFREQLDDHIPSVASAHQATVASIALLAQSRWEQSVNPDVYALVPDYGLDFGA
ncbi:tRNA (adenosine(37)-N6)-threonylcarbamoyltransferase complex dimerization subunit type 1 TsaB [candidate division KSB1 bacterium]|nr:tRNA (adenosine(37)-N6)-threonylcarbamoyltransferase complex dimerization subunit type 1 TsaB [candidate division KSB1 bacterium]